jgi:hypothetical protein
MVGLGPAILIYLIQPKLATGVSEDTATAAGLWSTALEAGAEFLACIKVAIPGTRPGEKGAEVKYMLNSVALTSWRLSVVEQTDVDDLADIDGGDDD